MVDPSIRQRQRTDESSRDRSRPCGLQRRDASAAARQSPAQSSTHVPVRDDDVVALHFGIAGQRRAQGPGLALSDQRRAGDDLHGVGRAILAVHRPSERQPARLGDADQLQHALEAPDHAEESLAIRRHLPSRVLRRKRSRCRLLHDPVLHGSVGGRSTHEWIDWAGGLGPKCQAIEAGDVVAFVGENIGNNIWMSIQRTQDAEAFIRGEWASAPPAPATIRRCRSPAPTSTGSRGGSSRRE